MSKRASRLAAIQPWDSASQALVSRQLFARLQARMTAHITAAFSSAVAAVLGAGYLSHDAVHSLL